METAAIKEGIFCVLSEMGITVEDDATRADDIDLTEYITDSVMYITFIIEVEKRFHIEIPDEFILYSSFVSLNGFTSAVESIINEKALHK